MWNPFRRAAAAPSEFFSTDALSNSGPVTIREQLIVLNEDICDVSARIGALGRSIRTDGTFIAVEEPLPVVTLQDAIEYLNTRVDLLNHVVDSMEDKLGF